MGTESAQDLWVVNLLPCSEVRKIPNTLLSPVSILWLPLPSLHNHYHNHLSENICKALPDPQIFHIFLLKLHFTKEQ